MQKKYEYSLEKCQCIGFYFSYCLRVDERERERESFSKISGMDVKYIN
jgi:hypothetical protein